MRCSHCKSTENLIKHCKDKTGRQYYYCNPCNTKRLKEYYKTNNGKKHIKLAIKRSEKKYPHKQAARIKLNSAVKLGKIDKPKTCQKCGKSGRIEGHHNDYSKPLNVLWLCKSCHSKKHKSDI